jgi:hypothetical protein
MRKSYIRLCTVAVVSDRVHGKEAEARVSCETALQISVMKRERPPASQPREAPTSWFAENEDEKDKQTWEMV